MTWEDLLISTYFVVCENRQSLSYQNERNSNNIPVFTDEEIMTIYLFCTIDNIGHGSIKQMYNYADRHLRSWFKNLPKYEAFNGRLIRLSSSFSLLSDIIMSSLCAQNADYQTSMREYIVDSLPIMLAKGKRAAKGKVAWPIANLGYCATKAIYYHGCKFHAAGLMSSQKRLPMLAAAAITKASVHDNIAFKENLAPSCVNSKVYADSAYCDQAAAPELLENYNVTVCPIQKRIKGQEALFFAQKVQNTAISTIRQPIEGFFNWLIEKTNIQNASKCRSTNGLLTHIAGKIAASAVFLLIFNS